MTDESFEREVLGSKLPVVVDFWAPWCGPCRAVEPIFEALAAELAGRLEFVRMDVDANPLTAAGFGVLSLPTALLFDGGKVRYEIIGAQRREKYERAWADWLQPAQQRGGA